MTFTRNQKLIAAAAGTAVIGYSAYVLIKRQKQRSALQNTTNGNFPLQIGVNNPDAVRNFQKWLNMQIAQHNTTNTNKLTPLAENGIYDQATENAKRTILSISTDAEDIVIDKDFYEQVVIFDLIS